MSTKIVALPVTAKKTTIEDVKRMERFKHFTNEQAAELLHVLETLSDIAYSIWARQQRKEQIQKAIPLIPSLQQESKAA